MLFCFFIYIIFCYELLNLQPPRTQLNIAHKYKSIKYKRKREERRDAKQAETLLEIPKRFLALLLVSPTSLSASSTPIFSFLLSILFPPRNNNNNLKNVNRFTGLSKKVFRRARISWSPSWVPCQSLSVCRGQVYR